MEYGPEHSKLIRQVFGEKNDSAIYGGAHWHDLYRNSYPRVTFLRDRPGIDNATEAKSLQGLVRDLLSFLHRNTLGRLFRCR